MRLGDVICAYRHESHIGVRDMAKEIGCSPATLSRLERNYNCDSDTLAKVMLWLLGTTRRHDGPEQQSKEK